MTFIPHKCVAIIDACQQIIPDTGQYFLLDSDHRSYGLYGQALSEGISEVLQSYKKTLKEVQDLVIGNQNYTLSFVYSHVEKFQGLFNTLIKIIVTIKQRRLIGCQILSLVHQYILTGDKIVHEAIIRYVK